MVAMLSSIAMTVAVAEDAPVYDVDNYPPQFDGQADAGSQPSTQPTPPPAQQAQPVQQPSQPPAVSQAKPQASDEEDIKDSPPPAQSLSPDQRLARVEQQMTNLQHSNSVAKLNDLQREVQALRGQVEDLTHQLQTMQTQQRSMYSDLDKRINKQEMTRQVAAEQPVADDDKPVVRKKALPKAQPVISAVKQKPKTVDAPVPASTSTAASSNAEQEELQMYQNAYDLIKDSKFDQAINVLRGMLKKYPSGQSAANAHYWLGELYGLQKKKDLAATEFAAVVKNYPDSPKVSDAEVKLGMIYAAEFNWPEAKATFKKVITRYPGTTSARLAAQQLKEIRAAGH